jgi:hypothetical protein
MAGDETRDGYVEGAVCRVEGEDVTGTGCHRARRQQGLDGEEDGTTSGMNLAQLFAVPLRYATPLLQLERHI